MLIILSIVFICVNNTLFSSVPIPSSPCSFEPVEYSILFEFSIIV